MPLFAGSLIDPYCRHAYHLDFGLSVIAVEKELKNDEVGVVLAPGENHTDAPYHVAVVREVPYHRRCIAPAVAIVNFYTFYKQRSLERGALVTMADPISIAGLAVVAAQVISSIYDYGMNVKDARNDIRSLSEELFALKGLLEHIGAQQNNSVTSSGLLTNPPLARYDPIEFSNMLQSTEGFLKSLLISLEEPKTRFKRTMQSLKWPFEKRDMDIHLARLGRVKAWFILATMTDSIAVTRDIYSEVLELTRSLNADREIREREKADSATQELLAWLAPVGPGEAHARALQVRQPGTGSWFIDGPFREWLNAEPGHYPVLWLSGSSGSGKTVLLSYAVETAQNAFPEGSGTGIGYYYCSFDDSASQLPVNILGSLAAQLSVTNPMLLEEFRPIFEREQKSKLPKTLGLTELEDSILKCSATLPMVLFFIDALNESDHYSLIAASLLRLTSQSKNLRILVTSTFGPPKTEFIWPPIYRIIDMPAAKIARDIQTCVESRLKQDPNLRGLSDKLKDDVRSALAVKSGGMFRWAQLSLLHLSAQRTGRDVRNALEAMPQDLNKTYMGILCRIPEVDRKLAREALIWLCFAERPLHIAELSEAVVLQESDTTLDSDSRLHAPQIVLEICQGLAQCQYSNLRVTLAHFSIKAFLVSEWIKSSSANFFSIDAAEAKKALMRKCLTYLCFRDFGNGYRKTSSDAAACSRSFPLFWYAAHNWAIYANSCELDAEDHRLIAKFLATKELPRGGNFSSWVQCLVRDMSFERIEATEPLYYAASFGLLSAVRVILTTQPGVDVDARGGRFNSTPLFIAIWRGHLQVVELLLEHGADPGLIDPSTGFTPLSYAYMKRLSKTAELLKRHLPRKCP